MLFWSLCDILTRSLRSPPWLWLSDVSIESTVRDHVNNTKRGFTQDLYAERVSRTTGTQSEFSTRFWMSNPIERSESIVAKLVSPSGKRTAFLKETKSSPKKRFVEIWNGDSAELILETTNRHGSFYGDGMSKRFILIFICILSMS